MNEKMFPKSFAEKKEVSSDKKSMAVQLILNSRNLNA